MSSSLRTDGPFAGLSCCLAAVALLSFLLVACTNTRLLTRKGAHEQRAQARKELQACRKALAAENSDNAQKAKQWVVYTQQYRAKLTDIRQLRRGVGNAPPAGHSDSVVFNPFGRGNSAPHQLRYRQLVWVEAININPFKYDVELLKSAVVYTYESPAAPSSSGGIAASLRVNATTEAVRNALDQYEQLYYELQLRYQRDDWPDDDGNLYKRAQDILAPASVTVENFVNFRSDLATQLSLRASIASGPDLTQVQGLQNRLAAALGGSDPVQQVKVRQQAEVLARVLLAVRPNAWLPRTRIQATAEGDETEFTLRLSKRPDYLVPPGREPGKLLEWKTTTQVTRRFRVSASAGAFVTGLRDYTYSLLADSVRTRQRTNPPSITDTSTVFGGYKRVRRIVRANAREAVSIGFTGLTHFHYRLMPSFDVAASLGIGAQTSGLQVLAGLTVLTGGEKQRLCLTGGVIGGKVSRLSGGYAEGQLVNRNLDVVPVQSINGLSWFVAVTYNLTAARQ